MDNQPFFGPGREEYVAEYKSQDRDLPEQGNGAPAMGSAPSSFRRARITRRRKRAEKLLKDCLVSDGPRVRVVMSAQGAVGPTPQTARKLKPDPLKAYEEKGILSSRQIWAAHAIRKAYRLITEGAGVRITQFTDVMVQNSRRPGMQESDGEILLKDRYSDWVDRMTAERLMVGPVFDMIVEEASLAATDRKWHRRKGWAKFHLQQSLDLYLAEARTGKAAKGDGQ